MTSRTTRTRSLGPWPKGLNLVSNRDLSVFLEPTELGQADNVVLTSDGFIEPRPGCKVVPNLYDGLVVTDTGTTTILGSVRLSTGEFVTLVQTVKGTSVKIYKVTDPNDLISGVTLYWSNTSSIKFNYVIAHKGLALSPVTNGHDGIFFMSASLNGSYVAPHDLSTSPQAINSSLNVPGSDGGIIVKDRLFLWNKASSTFTYSPATYVLDFTGTPDYSGNGNDISRVINVEPSSDSSDGITTVQYLNNNFYIFKRFKSFIFTYQADPYDDGYFRKFNTELGALDSVLYRNSLVVANTKGIFRVDVTDFIDIQRQLNLRVELGLDRPNIADDDIFITVLNDNILFGFNDTVNSVKHWYCMNGFTGGWTRWDFTYTADIAAPGSSMYPCQKSSSDIQYMLFNTFDQNRIVYMDVKPYEDNFYYTLDSHEDEVFGSPPPIGVTHYIPAVAIRTASAVGDSILDFKKLYRYFMRFFLSDIEFDPVTYPTGLWKLSINYNDYFFNAGPSGANPEYYFYPTVPDGADSVPWKPVGGVATGLIKRTYQLPIPQQRAIEFVFDLTRNYNSVTYPPYNAEAPDRPVKQGYYFLLAGIWFDYSDKVQA